MPAVLQRTVAGLPAWVWGAALGGGILVGLYLRRRSQAATDAAAGTDTAQAQDGTMLDATGSDMSGTASGDTADPGLGMGELPGQAYTGFGGGMPPAYPPPEARIDPALLKVLRKLAREEAEERRKKDKRHKGRKARVPNRTPHGPPPPRSHTMTGGVGQAAPRTTSDHYPAGTSSGVVV